MTHLSGHATCQSGLDRSAEASDPSAGSFSVASLPEPADVPPAADHLDGLAPALISVRLINIDHVCLRPGPLDRTECAFLPPGERLRKVPVLRIFGATPAGQRVCLHLHGVFPYCYIPYNGSLEPDHVLHYIARLGSELNAAITASLRGNPADRETHQHIAAIHIVKGVPFYGYHVGWRYFLKISFVDPSHNFRLATILQSGRVLRTHFQPHEVHIRYQLQFMLDYNVFGCDYIDLEEAFFRLPIPEGSSSPAASTGKVLWHDGSIPAHLVQSSGVHRVSFCELEIDAAAKSIINRRKLRTRNIHHDFDEDDEPLPNEKLVPSLRGLWEEETKRRLAAGLSPTPPPPDPTKDQRLYTDGEAPKWMAEDRWRSLLEARLLLDKRSGGQKRPRDITKPHPLDPHIATAFDSIEVFHYKTNELPSPAGILAPTHQTQLPSTMFNLEHFLSQQSGHGHESPGMEPREELDTSFFETQAFQTQLEDVERQLGPENGIDSDSDHGPEDDPMASGSTTPVPQTPRKNPSTPRGPQTPASHAFSPTHSDTQTSPRGNALLKSALRTPTKTLSNQHSVRLQSPLREPSTAIETPGRRGFHSSSPERTPSPSPSIPSSAGVPSTFSDNLDSSAAQPPASELVPPKIGSTAWFSAHILAQTKWRESAQTQLPTSASFEHARLSQSRSATTVPALTQVAASRADRVRQRSASHSGSTLPTNSNLSSHNARTRHWVYGIPAPSRLEVTASMKLFGLPPVEYQDPYYGKPKDVPLHSREYAGRSWKFASKTVRYLSEFPPCEALSDADDRASVKKAWKEGVLRQKFWQYGPIPPTLRSLRSWLAAENAKSAKQSGDPAPGGSRSHKKTARTRSTQQPSFGFKLSQRQPKQPVVREKQHMTGFAIEIHVNTRAELLPDPKKDPVQAIAYSFQNEDETLHDTGSRPGLRSGLILLNSQDSPIRTDRLGLSYLPVETVDSELDMFNTLVDIVRDFDPEILVGFEIHNGSWGYVIDRSRHHLGFDLVPELSRVNNLSTGLAAGKADNWGWTQTSALKITGRHILNIWRLMRGELNLNAYTYENIVFHLLRSRVPKLPFSTMTQWYRSRRPGQMSRVLKYWVERAETDLLIIETSELVFRTAEFARIYGIDFFSVISRGSQFKVESVMFRIAKPESFLLPSPNTKQVAEQNAAECLPLIMEPQSAFYKGPLLVLDFQSLYPSVMIAYNLCYSTCLGRVAKFRGTNKFGITELEVPNGLLTLLEDDVNISSNGLIFVKPHVRRSLLAKMLTEILDTRVMVKGSMKGRKSDKAFMRLQNARQLSLKLLANVTYGYTSATFSGRMPCVEIADAIVQTGRETLEKAIELIHATEHWGAQVVYGDTDSLFIYLPDRSKDDAFRIGNEIADAVTQRNPKPIKLKFEKVYLPSVLLAKKRYVGFKYENPDDVEPEFNAKGIETVRRDGFPALQKMLEACIRLLFTTQDLSLVKLYCQEQWQNILSGTVAIQDFIIAKEVRLGGYSENGVPPPGAAVSTRRMLLDPRSEPQHAERVPYLITQGEPRAKLNDLAVSPDTMLANPQLQLNALYYITRGIIPPLSRVFNLLGADVEAWFKEMPRSTRQNTSWQLGPSGTEGGANGHASSSSSGQTGARVTLSDHYRRDSCLHCGRPTERDVCLDCRQSPSATLQSLVASQTAAAYGLQAAERVCAHCSALVGMDSSPCVSVDCPVLYEKEARRRRERVAREKLARVEVALETQEQE